MGFDFIDSAIYATPMIFEHGSSLLGNVPELPKSPQLSTRFNGTETPCASRLEICLERRYSTTIRPLEKKGRNILPIQGKALLTP